MTRISTSASPGTRKRLRTGKTESARQAESKRSAHPGRRFAPHAAAVPLYDAPRVRQADSGAVVLGRIVQPLKRRKQLVRVGHVEADAVVAHGDFDGRLDMTRRNLDACFLARAGVLHRVVDDVLQHEPE